MQIRFQFNDQKAVAAMLFILERLGGQCDKAKLMKLLYIADREHFIRGGYPITGDSQVAMERGPLPSNCLDMLNGKYSGWLDAFDFIHIEDHRIRLRDGRPPLDVLDETEKSTLDDVLRSHGCKQTWPLVDETHGFPEYQEAYVENTSTPIPYETILKHYGGEAGFRHGRAVISEATMRHMISPFRGAETDL